MLDRNPSQHRSRLVTRRHFLTESGGGFAGLALATLLAQDQAQAAAAENPLAAKQPHFAPQAKQVIQIFCPGGVSHLDTFGFKPEWEKKHGKSFDESGQLQFFASKPGNCTKSYWKFRQHGQSGRWVSDLLPNLAECVDDMSFIYSMKSKSAIHGPAMFMMNTGFILPGFPAMGAWVTYGLGNETDDLPAFVVLPDSRGVPPGGPRNWGAGFLPAVYQGTAIQTAQDRPPIANLTAQDKRITSASERDTLELLNRMNRNHLAGREGTSELDARISAYELAARLQLSAPEVTNLSQETAETKALYGLADEKLAPFGRQCLLARWLVERGVRFVQIWCGAQNVPPPRPNWDAHENVLVNHGKHGPVLDQGAAALLKDLKRTGLLDDTLVICTSEFGRQPAAQGQGRDHNPGAFTTWLAGGGIKPGVGYGASDELGFEAAENPCYSYDLHATCLHLLGIDHEKLSYYHNGIERRLTDVHGHVIHELIA